MLPASRNLVTDDAISDVLEPLAHNFGSVPRAVFNFFERPYEGYNQLEQAIGRVTPDQLFDMLGDRLPSSEVSHQIAIMRRKEKATAPKGWDSWYVDVVSDRMRDLLQDKFWSMDLRKTATLISIFSGIPQTSVTAGWLFEIYAHRILTLDVPQNAAYPFRSLRRMSGAAANSLTHVTQASPSLEYLPYFNSTRRQTYTNIENLDLVAGTRCYLCPQKTNNPLFDAILIDGPLQRSDSINRSPKRQKVDSSAESKSRVYVLQMTTSHDHRGSPAGYEHLKWLKKLDFVERFVYVLVVPLRSGDRQYVWEMPEGWNKSGVKGDVYCLELDDVSLFNSFLLPNILISSTGRVRLQVFDRMLYVSEHRSFY